MEWPTAATIITGEWKIPLINVDPSDSIHTQMATAPGNDGNWQEGANRIQWCVHNAPIVFCLYPLGFAKRDNLNSQISISDHLCLYLYMHYSKKLINWAKYDLFTQKGQKFSQFYGSGGLALHECPPYHSLPLFIIIFGAFSICS